MTDTLHSNRFPGESASYRDARNKLLKAEMDLRKHIEEVAALRRQLPLGGAVPQDYIFEEAGKDGATQSVRLSELFAPGKDTLALYSYMYGPEMKEPCVSCTSILDGLNGTAQHAV